MFFFKKLPIFLHFFSKNENSKNFWVEKMTYFRLIHK